MRFLFTASATPDEPESPNQMLRLQNSSTIVPEWLPEATLRTFIKFCTKKKKNVNGSTDARPICEKLVLFLESSPAHFYELKRRKSEMRSALVPWDKNVRNSTRREDFCAGVVLPNALLTHWPRRERSFFKERGFPHLVERGKKPQN